MAQTPGPTRSDARARPAGITVLQGAALYVAAVLGTGVIALPALATAAAGPASIVAWFALTLLSIPLASTFAALGARHPDAGGVATYVRLAFGRRVAGVVGWCFLFGVTTMVPAAAMFAGDYVAQALGGHCTAAAAACALILGVVLLNAFGAVASGRVQLVLSALLVSLLVAAVAVSAPHARLCNLRPFAPRGWRGVIDAAALLMWSFAGWEAITHLAAEFRRPRHDIPRSTGIALGVVGVLYLGVAAATVLVLGPAAGADPSPLASLLATGLGSHAITIAAVAALALCFGTLNVYIAGAAKLGAALGRDGALPAWFAQGCRCGQVPRRALAVLATLVLGMFAAARLTGLGSRPLVLLTTGSFTLVYVLGTAAALRLLKRRTGLWLGACFALVADLGLLAATGWFVLWPCLIGAGALLYQRGARSRATPAHPAGLS